MALVPEKRMDKNGVLVTRHVSSGKASRSASRRIPAPTLTSEEKPDMTWGEAKRGMRFLYNYLEIPYTSDSNERWMPLFKKNPEYFHELTNHIREASNAERAMWAFTLERVSLHSSSGKADYEAYFKRTQASHSFMTRIMEEAGDVMESYAPQLSPRSIIARANSVRNQSLLHTMRKDTDYEKIGQAAILVAYVDSKSKGAANYQVDNLHYIEDHLDEIIPLIPEMISRGTTDAETLKSILSNASVPMRSGVL